MRSDASFGERFRFELIVLTLAVVLAAGCLLNYAPITISDDDKTGGAVMPQQLGQSDILLILPETNENAQSWSAFDFSFAWYNMLSQTVGPFSIALTSDIQSSIQSRLIVVPQRSAEMMTETQIQLVSQAVQLGSTLLIEMPSPSWAALTGVKQRARVSSAIKHFTDAQNSPLPTALRDQLLNTPLDMQAMRLETLDSETLPASSLLLELDGAIAHYRRQHGTGQVYVLAFNMGQVMTAMQQGRPGENFEIEPLDETPSVSDLVMSEKLRANPVPFIDLLKSHIMLSLMMTSPMPMLWPFPDAKRSALLLTHETGGFDDRAFALADYEKSLNVRSTWLVTASLISKETLELRRSQQFDIGVSFLRPPAGRVYKKYGPSFFQPAAVESNIVTQKNTVTKRLGAEASACKFALSQWTSEYTLPFRRMAHAGCRIDMTYGPVRPKEYGYLFGSGFPYLPLELNGLPMPTYEFPSILNDEAGLETIPPDAAVKLLIEAESIYHEPMAASFNADTMKTHPSYRAVQTWLDLLKTAQEHDILTTTVKKFMHHFTLRKQARVHYNFQAQTKTLNVQMTLPNAPFNYTAALPRRTQFGTLHDVWLDKSAVDLSTAKTTGDGLLVLIPAAPGDHLIQAQYQ